MTRAIASGSDHGSTNRSWGCPLGCPHDIVGGWVEGWQKRATGYGITVEVLRPYPTWRKYNPELSKLGQDELVPHLPQVRHDMMGPDQCHWLDDGKTPYWSHYLDEWIDVVWAAECPKCKEKDLRPFEWWHPTDVQEGYVHCMDCGHVFKPEG